MKITPKKNRLGINLLGDEIRSYLFPNTEPIDLTSIEVARVTQDLIKFDKTIPDINPDSYDVNLPDLGGKTPYDYLTQVALKSFDILKEGVNQLCKIPDIEPNNANFPVVKGWIKLNPDGTYTKEQPRDQVLILDCETYVLKGNYPVMAVALGLSGTYIWLHSSLVYNIAFEPELIPIADSTELIVGQSVSFDLARLDRTYSHGLYGLDTKSMNIATCGLGDRMLPAYIAGKHSFASSWASKASGGNDLISLYNHHCHQYTPLSSHDKTIRDVFVTGHLEDFKKQLQALIYYNILDVVYTHRVLKALWPKYLYANPELFTFAGHLITSSSTLPVISDWNNWLTRVDNTFMDYKTKASNILLELASNLAITEGVKTIQYDQLDWGVLTRGKNKGLPKWYANILNKGVSNKSDVAPILLNLLWEYNPVLKHPKDGWVFVTKDVDKDDTRQYKLIDVENWSEYGYKFYCKLPHPKGNKFNVGTPLSKDLLEYFNEGILTSENPQAKEVLDLTIATGYWTNKRKVISSFIPAKVGDTVWLKPDITPHGTTTRRATSVFLTMGEGKKQKIGTELKSRIQAPEGYKLVGADFATQELVIACGYADQVRGFLGSNVMSLVQYTGDKDSGTDGHTLLAKDANISRQAAKVMNFLMLFFGGVSACSIGLKLNVPTASFEWCRHKATQILELKRGKKIIKNGKTRYEGGTDSYAYNRMLDIVESVENRLPMSRSAISEPLQPRYIKNEYLPSRANRPIQSTGVDLLNCLQGFMSHFCRHLDYRYIISIHDEVWYTFREDHVSEGVYWLQISHMLTWAIFYDRFGFSDMPYVQLFFPEVNEDTVLRKEVDKSTLTPSNLIETTKGKSWNIQTSICTTR